MTGKADGDDIRAALCRDCGKAPGPKCAPARRLAHRELTTLSIAHIDCDAFYASVEKRDRPELEHRPVIIGGGKRGVVSAACYVARRSGVRSAMPMFKALAACPEAVVIKPNMSKYVAVSREVRALMEAATPLVEPISIDEAFLDLSGTERLHGGPPAATLIKLANRISRDIGIDVSIGLSWNKYLAKIASDLDKPRGFRVIGRADAEAQLAPLAISKVWGVGPKFAERLRAAGYARIADLQTAGLTKLEREFGAQGARLARLAVGEDTRHVVVERTVKSVSHETTFSDDISDTVALAARLHPLCEKTADRLRAKGFAGRTVTLKLKTADFRPIVRSRTLERPTALATRIFDVATDLLSAEAQGEAYRLIGVGVSGLVENIETQTDLFAAPDARLTAREDAIASLRAKFGPGAIKVGRSTDTRR